MSERPADGQASSPSTVPGEERDRRLNRAIRPLLVQYVLAFTGYLSLTPVLAVLVRDGWHQSGLVVGLALMVFSCSSRAGSIVLSPWIEGRSGVRVLLLANLVSGSCFLTMSVAHSVLPLIVLLAAGGTGVSLNGLVVRSVVAEWTSGSPAQVTAFAKLNVMLNLAAAVGPLIGTAALDTDAPWRLMVVIAAGYYAAALSMLLVVRKEGKGFERGGKRFSFRQYWTALRSSPFLRHVVLVSTVGWVLYAQMYSALPLHLFATTGSKLQVATYFTMSAIIIVVLQIPVSKGVARLMEARGVALTTVIGTGLGCFAAAFAVLALSGGDPVATYAAVATFTLGEILFAPSVDTAFAKSRDESTGGFVAVYTGKQFTLATGEGLGMLLGGGFFEYVRGVFSPTVYWAAFAAAGAAAAVWTVLRRVRTPSV
ncbi:MULTISPECIES: MFS transporter [unclassified Streptomyces]|uniref:MFS transporter n=1 Tax=unclassified Streptomyces TaxID=2593676 RepID=UPI0033276D68